MAELAPIALLFTGALLLFTSAFVLYRWDVKALVLSSVLLIGIIIFFLNSFETATSLVMPLIYGAFTGYTLNHRKSIQFYLIGSTAAATLYQSIHYYYATTVLGLDLIGPVKERLPEFLEKTGDSAISGQLSSSEMQMIFDLIEQVMPFNFFINTLLWSTISFILLKLFFATYISKKVIVIKGLEFYRLPDYFVFVFIAALAAFVLIKPDASEFVYIISINGLLISLMLYLIQTIGIIRHILIKRNIPLFVLPLVLTAVFLFSIPFLPIVAMMLAGWGILDLWADFRGLQKIDVNDNK